ncbi:MAG: hypothetical protein Q8R08_02510 [bacterium]|nr:hypothetical protein [bacterium]
MAIATGQTTATEWLPMLKIQATVAVLRRLQKAEKRNLAAEKILAGRATEYLHLRDHPDFMLCAHVTASEIFTTKYCPHAWLNRREDLLRIAQQIIPAVGLRDMLETPTRLENQSEVDSYFYGFHRGSELGYPEVLGDEWYLLLGSSEGFWYVPVSCFKELLGVSF